MSEPHPFPQAIPPHIQQVNRVNVAMTLIAHLVRPETDQCPRTPQEQATYDHALRVADAFLIDAGPLEDDA